MCDLNIVSGPSAVTVLPGQTGEHMITVSPWRRGKFAGVISFIALSRAVESTSDKRLVSFLTMCLVFPFLKHINFVIVF